MLMTQNHSYSNKYIGYQTLSFCTRSDSKLKNQPNFKKKYCKREQIPFISNEGQMQTFVCEGFKS